MNRVIVDESRLTNNTLCGIDTPFCYPITRPWENIIYLKPTVQEDFTFASMNVYDNAGNIVLVLIEATLYQYFDYVKAYDGNGEIYFMLRQKRPFYNLGGEVNPEIKCYRLYISLQGETTYTEYFSEALCYIDSYQRKHCVILADPNDTDSIQFEIECNNDGNPFIIDTAHMPLGYWVEYIGPFVDLFMPPECVLLHAVLGTTELGFDCVDSLETFGFVGCPHYVTLQGSGRINFDCKGRYYVNDTAFDQADNPYAWNVNNLPKYLSDYNIHIQGGKAKQLASKNTPKRYKGSCYIPNTEIVNRWKVTGYCPVPVWFMEEVNLLAASQGVLLTGSEPVADDNNNLITLLQSEEYQWKERQYSNFFLPQLYFETCICYENFTC